jgi:hypothetical protein
MCGTARRWLSLILSTVATATVVSASLLLAPGRGHASASRGTCVPDASAVAYVRAELVDRWGRSSGRFVDSRCPSRTLIARLASRFHYIRHTGVVEPGLVMTFAYVRSDSGVSVHSDVATAGRSGVFRTRIVDLASFMSRGDALTVAAHHESPTPTVQQDLIEYALLAGFVAVAP